jgi:hypothetical protein
MDPQKRSNIVVLTLVGLPFGAMALGSVLPAGQEMRRNLYPDRAACVRDYSAQQCEPHSGSSSGGGGGYHGPYYAANRSTSGAAGDPGAGRTGQITATQTSMRGGFGSFGRAMGAAS